jgi:hypothetical protein
MLDGACVRRDVRRRQRFGGTGRRRRARTPALPKIQTLERLQFLLIPSNKIEKPLQITLRLIEVLKKWPRDFSGGSRKLPLDNV